jgi:hypothetical protein
MFEEHCSKDQTKCGTAQLPINWQMDGQAVEYPHYRILKMKKKAYPSMLQHR